MSARVVLPARALMAPSTCSETSLLPEQVVKGAAVMHLVRIVEKPASLPPMEKVTRLVEEFRWLSWAGSFQEVLGL